MENKTENLPTESASASASVSDLKTSSTSPNSSPEEIRELQRLEILLDNGEDFLIKDLTTTQRRAVFEGITKYMVQLRMTSPRKC